MSHGTTRGALGAVAGMALPSTGAEPFPVRVSLAGNGLMVESDHLGGGGTQWPLSAVRTVEEVRAADDAQDLLEIRFDNGLHLMLTPTETFTSELVARLQHDAASPQHVVPSPAAGSHRPAEPARPGRRRWLTGLLVAVAALAIGAAAVTAAQFRSRALDAEQQAERRLDQLRTTEAELADLRADHEAMTKERDDLELRVSELANEKAAVQDERNAARELARLGANAAEKMLECRNKILDAMGYILDDYYLAASTALDVAVPVCQAANTAVAAFSDAVE